MPDAQRPDTLRCFIPASTALARIIPNRVLKLAAILSIGLAGTFGVPPSVAQPQSAAALATAVEPARRSVDALLEAASLIDSAKDAGAAQRSKSDAQRSEPDHAAVQQMLGTYIANKYRVSDKSLAPVLEAAWQVGGAMKLDPLLLLAVMAIESSFNPKAESGKGAQGLMQVMTRIHREKFEPFGGTKKAWHPEVNIQVGAQILKECISRRGSVPAGLTCYVGAPGKASAYGRKVLAERDRLRAALDVVDDGAVLTASAPADAATAAGEASTLTLAAREGDLSQENVEITASLTERDLTVIDM